MDLQSLLLKPQSCNSHETDFNPIEFFSNKIENYSEWENLCVPLSAWQKNAMIIKQVTKLYRFRDKKSNKLRRFRDKDTFTRYRVIKFLR